MQPPDMTAPSQKATTEHQRLQQLLLLVLGRPLVAAPLDWTALLELAEMERVASLAWRRSGDVIRRLAPATVAGRWRAHAMSVAFQVETLVGIVADASTGIQKYSLVGSSWVALGTIGVASDVYRGLTGLVNANAFCA